MQTNTAPDTGTGSKKTFWLFLLALGCVLTFLFHRSLEPNQVLFSNDGPLGAMVAKANSMPSGFFGYWQDLNWVGFTGPSATPNFSSILLSLCSPKVFLNVYCPLSLLLLGISAFLFFRQLKFHPVVCLLGGMAAALNGNFVSNGAWGQSSRPLSLAFSFLAMAAVLSSRNRFSWIKIILAGFAVGLGVTEGFDVGAIFSLYVAAFVVFFAWTSETAMAGKVRKGIAALAVVAICAGVIATQTIVGLVGTQIKGVAMVEQKAETPEEKQMKWDFATQWSISKAETLRVIIPGLFGYRMADRSGHIYPGAYWGKVGQTPGNPASRFNGSGEYAGVLVVFLALYAVAAALRKNNTMPAMERKWILFWAILAFISLLLAWGRFAPFYQLFYALPYAATIRNPMKFMHPFHFALIILFGYGLQSLYREYIERSITKTDSFSNQVKKWWASANNFEKKWQIAAVGALAVSLLGALVYSSSKRDLQKFLQSIGFDASQSTMIASNSTLEVWIYVLFLAVAVLLVTGIMSGWLSGQRAKWAGIFMAIFLAIDLGRADAPWIIYWDAKQKYESNPVLETLKQNAHEHRTIMLPFNMPQMQMLSQLYGIELLQQIFQYHNIQSLDVIQEPRASSETVAYRRNFGTADKLVREWELTNTKYFFGMAGQFVSMLNQQLDPEKQRFKLHTAFRLVPKSGVSQPDKLEDLTMLPDPNGEYALIEFTGTLPRAKLYANWQVSTNNEGTLKTLADPKFDPQSTVILEKTDGIPAPSSASTASAGTVTFDSYEPKKSTLSVNATAPSMLLLNDRDNPDWHATVDGQPAKIYRANYLMRAVYLPAGQHKVVFQFKPSMRGFYISLAAVTVGILLLGVVVAGSRRREIVSGAEVKS